MVSQNYFRLCSVIATFLKDLLSQDKASNIGPDGLEPLLGKRLCNDIASSEGTFTVLFDETTTVQIIKQMDVLISYWNESEGLIVT